MTPMTHFRLSPAPRRSAPSFAEPGVVMVAWDEARWRAHRKALGRALKGKPWQRSEGIVTSTKDGSPLHLVVLSWLSHDDYMYTFQDLPGLRVWMSEGYVATWEKFQKVITHFRVDQPVAWRYRWAWLGHMGRWFSGRSSA